MIPMATIASGVEFNAIRAVAFVLNAGGRATSRTFQLLGSDETTIASLPVAWMASGCMNAT